MLVGIDSKMSTILVKNNDLSSELAPLKNAFDAQKRTLRVPDCNFRESLAKLEKSKFLIICLKFTFGELSSKILFECSGNL